VKIRNSLIKPFPSKIHKLPLKVRNAPAQKTGARRGIRNFQSMGILNKKEGSPPAAFIVPCIKLALIGRDNSQNTAAPIFKAVIFQFCRDVPRYTVYILHQLIGL